MHIELLSVLTDIEGRGLCWRSIVQVSQVFDTELQYVASLRELKKLKVTLEVRQNAIHSVGVLLGLRHSISDLEVSSVEDLKRLVCEELSATLHRAYFSIGEG